MAYDPSIHHRKSIRLKGFDYTQPGAYFVTIVAHKRMCLFGEITDGKMRLNEIGNTITGFWREIPNIYHHVDIDEFIVMPNHLHGIIIIHENVPPIRNVGATQWDETIVPYGTVGATQWVAPTNAFMHSHPANNGGRNIIQSGSIGSIIGQFKSVATKHINRFCHLTHTSVWQRNYHEHIIRDTDELFRIRKYIRNNPVQWDFDT